jgi:hypothetical protein
VRRRPGRFAVAAAATRSLIEKCGALPSGAPMSCAYWSKTRRRIWRSPSRAS